MVQMFTSLASCTTLPYKRLSSDEEVLLDFYPPEISDSVSPIMKVPAVVFFHAGGLMMGNRRFLFPSWLQKSANALGYAFISADYQLLLPGTGHDILKDIRDVFKFAVENHFTHQNTTYEIDSERILAAGGSAGGCMAHLAAAHITFPKLTGVLALYPMGGDFLTSHWLKPKTKPFFMGRPLRDPAESKNLLPPFPEGLPAPMSEALPAIDPTTGLPAEPRMPLTSLSIQLGTWLDYYTGEFNPSLSEVLRDALDAGTLCPAVSELVPDRHRSLFPTFLVNASWPPVLMVHGTADTAVPIVSSRRMNVLLKNAGVDVELIEVEGQEHLFDTEQNADIKFAEVFKKVGDFMKGCRQN
ncbi:Alpha/Beta hydrolase protein [Crassisporium funariophilum]|nr:Alpha/Beta hydrolase protein [Crassisporium funariophilum]